MTPEEMAEQIVRIASDGTVAIEVEDDTVLGRGGFSLVKLTCIAEPYGTYLRRKISRLAREVQRQAETGRKT